MMRFYDSEIRWNVASRKRGFPIHRHESAAFAVNKPERNRTWKKQAGIAVPDIAAAGTVLPLEVLCAC